MSAHNSQALTRYLQNGPERIEPRPRGRPPLPPGQAKRAHFTTRLRTELKEKLRAAAEANGRSLSEEIEYRLEQSFPLPGGR